jgi:hypothetical protein
MRFAQLSMQNLVLLNFWQVEGGFISRGFFGASRNGRTAMLSFPTQAPELFLCVLAVVVVLVAADWQNCWKECL